MFKKTFLNGAVLALMSMTLAGCGLFSGSTAHEPVDLVNIQPTEKINAVWSASVGESVNGMLTPVVVDNAVYAAGGKTLRRLDPANGRTVWSVDLGHDVAAGVGSDGLTQCVVTVDGMLHAYNAEGKAMWTAALSTDAQVPPLVGNGLVVVMTSDSRIVAYDEATGTPRWHYLGQVPPLTVRVFKALSWSPAGILVGQANGRLLALDPEGKPVFDLTVANASGITEVERLVDVVGRPLVSPNVICAAAFQGEAVCMHAQNGALLWVDKVDAVTGPVSDGNLIYVVDSRGTVHAYNGVNGHKVWENGELTYRQVSTPVPFGDNGVAVGDYEGVISVMDRDTGRFMARTKLSGAVNTPAVPMGHGAVFQTVKGDVTFLTPQKL